MFGQGVVVVDPKTGIQANVTDDGKLKVDTDASYFSSINQHKIIVSGDSPTLLTERTNESSTYFRIKDFSNYDLFIGNNAVTSGDGYPIFAQTFEDVQVDAGSNLYGILGADITGDIRVLELG